MISFCQPQVACSSDVLWICLSKWKPKHLWIVILGVDFGDGGTFEIQSFERHPNYDYLPTWIVPWKSDDAKKAIIT